MKNKLSAILIAMYLLAGCSSGGGTAGGAGGSGITTTAGGLLLVGAVSATDSISQDAFISICTPAVPATGSTPAVPAVLEDGLTTKLGTFSITLNDIVDLTGGLFPVGVTLERYTVSYVAQGDAGAPALASRTHTQTVTLLVVGTTVDVSVILMDLGFTIPEFASKTSGAVSSYRVTVTWTGRTLSGDSVTLSASTFIEIGNFDRC